MRSSYSRLLQRLLCTPHEVMRSTHSEWVSSANYYIFLRTEDSMIGKIMLILIEWKENEIWQCSDNNLPSIAVTESMETRKIMIAPALILPLLCLPNPPPFIESEAINWNCVFRPGSKFSFSPFRALSRPILPVRYNSGTGDREYFFSVRVDHHDCLHWQSVSQTGESSIVPESESTSGLTYKLIKLENKILLWHKQNLSALWECNGNCLDIFQTHFLNTLMSFVAYPFPIYSPQQSFVKELLIAQTTWECYRHDFVVLAK